MPKTEVYSWRLNPAMKMELEAEARRHGHSLSELLEHIMQKWLAELKHGRDDAEEQARINAAAAKSFGAIAAGPDFSENTREKVRARLKERYARKRSA